MLAVNGRGLRSAVIRVTFTPEGMRIRVDDNHNPEFWFEVSMDEGTLFEWVDKIADAKFADVLALVELPPGIHDTPFLDRKDGETTPPDEPGRPNG
jgi:hypothetical protein